MRKPRRAFTAALSVLALSGAMLAAGSAAPASAGPFNTKLQTHHSGKCLDVANASTADGAFVQQWRCYSTANQNWNFTSVGDGYYTVSADHSDKCLDVAEASVADGGTVHQWRCYTTPNQEWRLVQRPNGYFTLVARHSGKCLEVTAGNIYDGAGVVQQTCAADRPYQEWRLL
ncbi:MULTISPECIES: RICIN domain-containing protein [Streptomyces]|uniref:Arabinogalactan endo-1,4-beta-galactosidase n=1 Tax=Streptomyces lycii TaxID=2654337 RepID=A0ABQ7FGM0_9ACTN|nr:MULTISPECIES: RICIN domain-containing protein [Streptomyces]KAF4407732.1 arabinogalactan endo-1,4-beta-galactosidase [Streptomyces lycii]